MSAAAPPESLYERLKDAGKWPAPVADYANGAECDSYRAVYDALNRGDWDAALPQHVAPGFELDFSRAIGPGRGVYEGRDQLRRFLAELGEGWESVGSSPTSSSKPVISSWCP